LHTFDHRKQAISFQHARDISIDSAALAHLLSCVQRIQLGSCLCVPDPYVMVS
jgi:hypothetical protein